MSKLTLKEARQRRHRRVRARVIGTAAVPRMSVCTTGKHIYVQFVDDSKGCTLASVSTLDPVCRDAKLKTNVAGAEALGKLAAERAVAISIKRVVFDRGGFRFHGRVKAIAEAARKAGLEF